MKDSPNSEKISSVLDEENDIRKNSFIVKATNRRDSKSNRLA